MLLSSNSEYYNNVPRYIHLYFGDGHFLKHVNLMFQCKTLRHIRGHGVSPNSV
jgi:hypothetical protein